MKSKIFVFSFLLMLLATGAAFGQNNLENTPPGNNGNDEKINGAGPIEEVDAMLLLQGLEVVARLSQTNQVVALLNGRGLAESNNPPLNRPLKVFCRCIANECEYWYILDELFE